MNLKYIALLKLHINELKNVTTLPLLGKRRAYEIILEELTRGTK